MKRRALPATILHVDIINELKMCLITPDYFSIDFRKIILSLIIPKWGSKKSIEIEVFLDEIRFNAFGIDLAKTVRFRPNLVHRTIILKWKKSIESFWQVSHKESKFRITTIIRETWHKTRHNPLTVSWNKLQSILRNISENNIKFKVIVPYRYLRLSHFLGI